MKMSLRSSYGWRLRESPFHFQQTYKTPLPDLPRFVDTLLAPFESSNAEIWIETIVFQPNELIEYLKSFGIVTDEGELNRATLYAENKSETATLLKEVLEQWIDFAFIPSPKTFVIYADHDEYTTIFTESAQTFAVVRSNMKIQGFTEIEDWLWTDPHSQGKIEEGQEDV